MFTGIDSALLQVDNAVSVTGKMFFQWDFNPFLPSAMNIYNEHIIKYTNRVVII